MLPAIMAQMTTLTERFQIAGSVVAGVVIEMRRGQHHLHPFHRRIVPIGWPVDLPAPIISPELVDGIEPPTITEMMDGPTVGSTTLLTAPAGAIEPHCRAELLPIDRVIPAKGFLDRHQSHIL